MNKKKIREYIACPQFGDKNYGAWGILTYEQRNCIRELLEENEYYDEWVRELINRKNKAILYLTSYESIKTIEGIEDSNVGLNKKTMEEMVRRYLIVHDKALNILEGENE